VKRPVLAAVLSMLLCTMLVATCDPVLQHVVMHYYEEIFERTHLRFRQIDACRFEVLDDLPPGPGRVLLWYGGTSRGYFSTGFPGDMVRYDAGSRILEDLDCRPDAGLPPPHDVTFDSHSYAGPGMPIEDGPFKPFIY